VKDLARILALVIVISAPAPVAPAARSIFAQYASTAAAQNVSQAASTAAAPKPTADERIQRLIGAISEERLQSIVVKLAGFGTRETLSDTTSSTGGIGAARQWIFDELKRSSPRLNVFFDTYQIAPQGRIPRAIELRNVIAILPGRTARRIYITGHYDSVNLGPASQQRWPRRLPARAARIRNVRRNSMRTRMLPAPTMTRAAWP
jgi:hypothetical protein